MAWIYGLPGPETSRSESVRDFQIFVGPGPVRDLEFLSVLVRAGTGFLKFFRFWSGPRTRTESLGPGPIGFGPWIPGVGYVFLIDYDS